MTEKIINPQHLTKLKNTMRKQMPIRELLQKALILFLAAGTAGFALKFTTYFDNWYWLPTWPNAFDAFFLITVAIALAALGLRRDK